MKLKTKPRRPRRESIDHKVTLCEPLVFDILPRCIEYLIAGFEYTEEEASELSDKDIRLEFYHGWYDEVDLVAKFTLPESDAGWTARLEKYNERLRAYKDWESDNAAEIAAEIERRDAEQQKKDAEKLQRDVERLGRQLAQKQSKLDALG